MLGEEMIQHLTRDLIPFWETLADEEYGGFYGYMGYDLKVDEKAVKGCILNSRILWFFSNAYLLLQKDSLLFYASHAYEFLKNHCLDKANGGVYWSVTFNGQPEETIKHTYNQAFAIYALSSYYDASKDEEALKLSKELFKLIETKCTDEWGYKEAFDKAFHTIDNEKLSENGIVAEKTMNTLLHVLEAYTELFRVSRESEVRERMRFILNTFAEHVYNQKQGRQEVFFDRKWNSLIDLYSYGHDIETAWLIDRGCEILGDEDCISKMGLITKEITANIYDRAYVDSSLFNESLDGINDTTRIWWVQAEAVVGFLNGYEKCPGESRYLEAANAVWDYIKTCMIDPRSGSEWYWAVDQNRAPIKKPIVEPWKCPYHNGRMCFEVIRRMKHDS
jgi:mannobiose 2-epimerase